MGVFGYDEEGRLVKIERDYGNGDVQLAYEYGYNSDGVRVWKRDGLAGQEYRYLCRIGCGGVPMRVYNRAMSGGSWASMEDYLPAGNALGYNQNWRYRHTGGEWLMMGATGEPSGYYPTDSNGLAVQSEPPVACVCYVAAGLDVCAPLEYGECEGGKCAPQICIPGTCNDPGTPNPGSPRVPNPNDHVYVQGFGLIVVCLTNPACRAVAMCLAAALGAALADFLYQLIRGTCCNWCSIGCSALCGCLALGAGIIIGRLLPPPLGQLIGGGAAFGVCVGCCGRILGC
jgi:hypothetical protein